MVGRRVLIAITAFGFFAGAGAVEAQSVQIGPQLSLAEDTDFGIGPRLEIGLVPAIPGLRFAASFDYFFPDNPTLGGGAATADNDYWELNGNLLYGFGIPSLPGFDPYVGAGINIAHASSVGEIQGVPFDDSDTDAGVNLVGGAQFPIGGLTPFLEARLELRDDNQLVVAGGFLFP